MGIRRKPELLEPTKIPTNIDIAWAAGIWEGEGSMAADSRTRATVVVTQKDPEILYRLRDWFGGTVHPKKTETCHVWQACGDRGRYFIALIYPLLSTRRRVQVDNSGILGYLGNRNVCELSYEEIWDLLDSRPARKRRSDALDETPEEKKKRHNAAAVRYYWKNRPEVIGKMSLRRVAKKVSNQVPTERVM
jgi:hypothetical protein